MRIEIICTGDEVLTEYSPEGDDGAFLNGITKPWQAATQAAADAGARVCIMRTSFVLDARGGSFRPLAIMFRLGLGGPASHGTQYFSTISLNDWLRAVTFLAENDSCEGVYNLTGPNPTTNAEFVCEISPVIGFSAWTVTPTSIELRGGLDRTATGKLQKFKLREPYWAGRTRRVN